MVGPYINYVIADVRMKAAQDSMYQVRCKRCAQKVFFVEHTEAKVEGHIYSDLGVAEFGISRLCEYCFDLITMEPDEDEDFSED